MVLTTEEMGEVPDVTAADIDRILLTDSFGKFAILAASEKVFIQAGNDWQPGPECKAFLRKHESDPWVLEYRDKAGKQFRAKGQVTLEQVRQAFLSYLARGKEWQQEFTWEKLRL
jgi:hypothetical protein